MLTIAGRAAVAEVLLGATLLASYVLSWRLVGGTRILLRWLGIPVIAATLASIQFHVLSALGAFDVPGAIAAVGLSTTLVVALAGNRAEIARRWARDVRWLYHLRRRFARNPERGIGVAFTFALLIVVLHSLLLPPLGWDSLTYHAVKAAKWVQHEGGLDMKAPGPWSVYENFWGGAEVFTAWAMLPFHGDTLAMAMQSLHWLGLGFAIIVLARELGVREPYPSSAAVFVLAIPTIRMQVGTGYVEVALLFFMVCGIAFAATALRRPDFGSVALAAASLGLAAGVKVSIAPLAAVAVAVLCVRLVGSPTPAVQRFRRVTAVLLMFGLMIAPWLWRSYRSSGAPLTPIPIEVFGIELGRSTPEVDAYLVRPIPKFDALVELGRLRETLLEGYEGLGAAPLVAMALGLVSWPRLLRRRRWAASLILLVIAANWAVYYSRGLAFVRHYWPASSVRFLLVAAVLCSVLSVAALRPRSRAGRLGTLFLWAASGSSLGAYLIRDLSAESADGILKLLLALVIVGGMAAVSCRIYPASTTRLGASIVAPIVALVVISYLHDERRAEMKRVGFMNHLVEPYWFESAAGLDDPEKNHRIAVTAGPWVSADNWFVYPFMGRRLQNEVIYVPVSADGTVGHFGLGPVNEEYARTADFSAWLKRLYEREVTEVMSFSPVSIELHWMETHEAVFQRLAGDSGDWGLFAVRRGLGTPSQLSTPSGASVGRLTADASRTSSTTNTTISQKTTALR